ncbi:MAG: ABC transporter permease [Desulfobacula sp.]|jgi:ABC-type polysaccharide/polyol phosphate export permease|uniref:ABC transporter permease n=1 Tax=Desulfobacula sp. TaxID=2593537 RepID=UPI001DF57EFC|nr:ABC transporter permease [Desulfobacula sp.]MBT3485879.1 ABC transporter permease [Desulfobacula sp.]MBT3805482.1 ABC transporter permease [Desulfobacula sp.]MBT4026803.1 ABC transporter permease [Desulfobacula sp.]MBT4199593.1 ABC transporter permease [Desulfobacula sp.]
MFNRLKNYKDLFFVFVWRELLIRYKQTAIGVLWALIQPLSMMALFVIVFGYVLNINTKGYPRSLFYFAGLVPWTFFSSSVNASINSLIDHRDLITKIYFPRELIIFSRISVFITDFIISAMLLAAMVFFCKTPFTLNFLWVIPLCVLLFLFTASVCLLFGTINVYYRDMRLASGFLLQVWFFSSPVFYSIDTISLKMKLFLFLNPLTYIIENFRRVLIEERGIVLWQFAIAAGFVMALFFVSYKIFIRLERSFADVI